MSQKPNPEYTLEQVIAALTPFLQFHSLRYARNGLEYDDLVQEGALGIVRAYGRWDAAKGANPITYCSKRALGAIQDLARKTAKQNRHEWIIDLAEMEKEGPTDIFPQ